MIVEAAVISAAVAAIQPYLVKLGEGLGDKAVEAGIEAGPKLFAWVKDKLGGKATESEAAKDAMKALDRLEKAPDDADKAAGLRVALSEALEEEPELYAELKAMLPKATADTGDQNANVSGAGAKVAQVRGQGNLTSIG